MTDNHIIDTEPRPEPTTGLEASILAFQAAQKELLEDMAEEASSEGSARQLKTIDKLFVQVKTTNQLMGLFIEDL